ncbi:MAG: hypothetical protein KDJ29_20540, partial [Hyphomicrobiales bacterium]|nr:hypothetical protein [Hyphomicrobiales bacterium]
MVENSEGHQQPIIIVRRGNHGDHDDHHGGVWKVAFADFMTAMMAFFLVLWIVNSTSKETRSSVARYFNPLQLTNTTAARKGLKTPDESSFDADATDNKKDIVSPSGEKSTSSDNVKKKANGKASGDATAEAEDKKEKKDKHDKKDKKDKSAKKADGKAAQAEAAAAESKLLVRVVPPNTRQD